MFTAAARVQISHTAPDISTITIMEAFRGGREEMYSVEDSHKYYLKTEGFSLGFL